MATLKRHALVRRHETLRPIARTNWPRQHSRYDGASIPPDNQIIRGLLIGLPLGVAIWLLLALFIWWIA